MVELLLLKGADKGALDTDKLTPLSLADRCGRVDIMRVLIEHSADVNHAGGDNQRSILHVAAYDDTDGAISVLIEAGPTSKQGMATALHLFIALFNAAASEPWWPSWTMVQTSTPDMVSINQHRCTTQRPRAAVKVHIYMVVFLLQPGADERIVDEDGNT